MTFAATMVVGWAGLVAGLVVTVVVVVALGVDA